MSITNFDIGGLFINHALCNSTNYTYVYLPIISKIVERGSETTNVSKECQFLSKSLNTAPFFVYTLPLIRPPLSVRNVFSTAKNIMYLVHRAKTYKVEVSFYINVFQYFQVMP